MSAQIAYLPTSHVMLRSAHQAIEVGVFNVSHARRQAAASKASPASKLGVGQKGGKYCEVPNGKKALSEIGRRRVHSRRGYTSDRVPLHPGNDRQPQKVLPAFGPVLA